MTGVLRIAKGSIFSGLNNLDVFSVLNSQYSDVFGFTNPEITAMARDLGYQDKIGEIKQWYDGYCFGNTEVYNPWSVIQYMDKTGEPQPYWVNTAENNILKELLIHAKPQRIHELQRLVQGASVSATLHDSIMYDELWRDDDALYTMLLTTGYLTVQEKSDEIYNRYALRIPNKEINYVYSTEILNTLIHGMSRNDFDGLFDALVHGKAADFEQRLQRVLLGFVSTFDTAQKESFYHGFMLGITALFCNSQYIVESNQESGYGRFDIALFPKNTTKAGVILEFKVTKTADEMKQKAEEALSQIDSKQYITSFQKRGILSVWKYGIAFCGKKVLIKRA